MKHKVSLRYIMESFLVMPLLFSLRALPLDAASWAGGRLACLIGPHSRKHRVAVENLQRIYPAMAAGDQENYCAICGSI